MRILQVWFWLLRLWDKARLGRNTNQQEQRDEREN